jgi:hypothetical protein
MDLQARVLVTFQTLNETDRSRYTDSNQVGQVRQFRPCLTLDGHLQKPVYPVSSTVTHASRVGRPMVVVGTAYKPEVSDTVGQTVEFVGDEEGYKLFVEKHLIRNMMIHRGRSVSLTSTRL